MRRRRIYPDLPPQHLREFNRADWPAKDDHEALELWIEACKGLLRFTVGTVALWGCFGRSGRRGLSCVGNRPQTDRLPEPKSSEFAEKRPCGNGCE